MSNASRYASKKRVGFRSNSRTAHVGCSYHRETTETNFIFENRPNDIAPTKLELAHSTRKADPERPASGAGNEIRTHDFNLGNIRLAPNTIREIQQYQLQRVLWRCVPSRGVPWKVEGWVEDSGWDQVLRKPSVDWNPRCWHGCKTRRHFETSTIDAGSLGAETVTEVQRLVQTIYRTGETAVDGREALERG